MVNHAMKFFFSLRIHTSMLCTYLLCLNYILRYSRLAHNIVKAVLISWDFRDPAPPFREGVETVKNASMNLSTSL